VLSQRRSRATLATVDRVWVFDRLAVAVTCVDFLDPEVAGIRDARERGVRIEVRLAVRHAAGSIYASDACELRPAVCRIDFLESSPGAADRMHWHPQMQGGEPGDRTFDVDMPADPVGWLAGFWETLGEFLDRAGAAKPTPGDLHGVRAARDEIGAAVARGLAWARQPWPDVVHDERGMAPVT
jgi:hypothetical protein